MEQKYRILTKTHRVKNVSGAFDIKEYVKWNPFETLLKTVVPKQNFFIFQFHEFFDGLIGYESLRTLNPIINTTENSLQIGNETIIMQKKYPSKTVNLNSYEEMTIDLFTNLGNGDYYIDSPSLLTGNIFVMPGLYSSKDNKTTVLIKNTSETTAQMSPTQTIFADLNNFDTCDFDPGKHNNDFEPNINRRLRNQLRIEHLNSEERESLLKIISRNSNVFYLEGTDLSFTNLIKHRIETRDELPVHAKSYRYPYCHKQEVQRQISEMLSQGIIRPSTSPWCSPIWIVPKKADASGRQKWRLVVDYRKLNEKTVADKYPLPNITEILDKLGRCQYFTTLDLASGFHQIEVHPSDVQKTAFSVEHGLYEYLRMPFGLKNAPATF